LDHSIAIPFQLAERDWRKLALVLGAVAAVELVLVLVLAIVLIAPSISHHLEKAAKQSTVSQGAVGPHTPGGKAHLTPAQTPVMVLNGNGRGGAAAAGASHVKRLGYKLGLVGNAQRMDYPVSLVMYRPGMRAEALKFAKRMGVRSVGPLDGIKASKLGRAKLVYILGAS
jgi:hypothetical protein